MSTIIIRRAHWESMRAHALAARPAECCGLIGGLGSSGKARTLYPLRNVALDPLVAYEGAPEELFAAQRRMRERGEQLLAIYHSHPRADDPVPSATDVRLAFYPSAVHFIIGLAGAEPQLRAFRLYESERRWEPIELEIVGS